MRRARRLVAQVVALACAAAVGCATPTTTAPPQASDPMPPSGMEAGPFLAFPPTDAQRYAALAKEQEAVVAACTRPKSCERAHFMLGLIALGRNRETAAWHFASVAAAGQRSPLTAPSELWIKLLQTPMRAEEPSTPLLHDLMSMLVREYLDRELGLQDLLREQRAAALQALQQELSARDQRIKSLSDQLEALKQVDDDIREKTRPLATRPVPAPPRP